MTSEQALKASGLSRRTFEILLGGGVTLPQLALKVGKALKLTQEEVKQLGKPLAKASWDAQKLPYKPIDVDPEWYRKLRGNVEAKDEVWVDRKALLQILLERGIDQKTFYDQYPGLRTMNYCQMESRMELIKQISEALGVPEEKLTSYKRQIGSVEAMYTIRQGRVEALMRERNMNRLQLAGAMWPNGGNERTPYRRLNRMWEKIRAGEPVSKLRAEAIARVLEVEVKDIADIAIRFRRD